MLQRPHKHCLYTISKLILFLLFCLTFITNSYAESKTSFNVGIVPQFETSRLHTIWQPILNQLEIDTGYKFQLQGSPSIPEFEKEFLAGKFDFAYMNPYHLVLSQKSIGYKPLLRDHSRMLEGVLVVNKKSNISDISQLQGKLIAFPSPNALGASLMIRAELYNKHHITVSPKYVNTHDSVYLNVVLNQTVAGGGVQKTLNKQKAAISDKLKVLYRTQKVAPHPFSVHPRIEQATAIKVQQALLNLAHSEKGQLLLENIPMKQIGPAKMNDYKILSSMGLEEFRISN